MISAPLSTTSAAAASSSATAAKIAALSQKAGLLREALVHPPKDGSAQGGSTQTSDLSRQLDSIETQINQMLLAQQLARLGSNAASAQQAGNPQGSGKDGSAANGAASSGNPTASPVWGAPANHAASRLAGSSRSAASTPFSAKPSPYGAADGLGSVVDLKS